MFRACFVCYRSDKYLNATDALRANAMFQPSSNVCAWDFKTDSLSEIKELVEICTMYNEIPSKQKTFGIVVSNVFLSVSDVVKSSSKLLSGEVTIFDLIMTTTDSKNEKKTSVATSKEKSSPSIVVTQKMQISQALSK